MLCNAAASSQEMTNIAGISGPAFYPDKRSMRRVGRVLGKHVEVSHSDPIVQEEFQMLSWQLRLINLMFMIPLTLQIITLLNSTAQLHDVDLWSVSRPDDDSFL